jgi:hypothetical protein
MYIVCVQFKPTSLTTYKMVVLRVYMGKLEFYAQHGLDFVESKSNQIKPSKI